MPARSVILSLLIVGANPALGVRAADSDEEVGAAATEALAAPLESDDLGRLAQLGRDLPLHGRMPLAAPAVDAAVDVWLDYTARLISVFAPRNMRRVERQALLVSRPLSDAVLALVPVHRRYRALQEALWREARRLGEVPLQLPKSPYRIAVGVTAPEVALLRERLLQESYGDPGVGGRRARYFDKRLRNALHAWQKDHGLPPTVVLDSLTRRRLNAPFETPVADLALALSRYRALDMRTDAERQLIVHINAYRLFAERAGVTELEMPVIVGRDSEADRTPHLSTRVNLVVVNPTWGVPRRIIDEQLRPEARDVPELLIAAGYDVTVGDDGRWRVRMPPGPDNPLGKIKFQLDRSEGIYLHGTNAPALFERRSRGLSHGCVRLADPLALARWILPGRELDLDEAIAYATLQTGFDGGGVPTELVYQTIAVADGKLTRFEDIYGLDAEALGAIDARALAEAIVHRLQ